MKDRRLRVLYVEDAARLRTLVVSALDAVRFRVVVAAGIDAAKFLASRERFDAVICGSAATARAVWEFICGRPTRLFVVSEETDASLPPHTLLLRSPGPVELTSALLTSQSSARANSR